MVTRLAFIKTSLRNVEMVGTRIKDNEQCQPLVAHPFVRHRATGTDVHVSKVQHPWEPNRMCLDSMDNDQPGQCRQTRSKTGEAADGGRIQTTK